MSRARDVADKNLAVINAGSDGQILTSDGADWSAQNAPTELPAHGSDGNILTSTGSAWASEANPLPAHGTSGNVLTSTGSAWASQAAAGGGSWDLLATTTVSATQNLDFRGSSIFDNSTYGMYCAVFANCNVDFGGSTGSLRTTWLRDGSSTVSQDIIYAQVAWYSSLETSNSGSGNTGYAQLIANDGPGAIMGQVWFTLEASAANGTNTGGPAMTWQITENTGFLNNGRAKTAIGHAFINQNTWNTTGTGIDGIRFYTEYSTWHSGKIYMYGLKK